MKPYLEKCVGRFLLSGEVSPSVFSSEKTDWGAAGEMGMGGSSHFLAAATQSSLAPLQSCLVEDSIVLLNIVFLLQQKRTNHGFFRFEAARWFVYAKFLWPDEKVKRRSCSLYQASGAEQQVVHNSDSVVSCYLEENTQ